MILGAAATTGATGCVSTYQYDKPTLESGPLKRDAGVYVCTPEDGWYATTQYPNSGKSTARAIGIAFDRYASRMTIGGVCTDEECLDEVDAEQYGYVVCPTILHWENRATEWSALPDRIRIKIEVFDARSRLLVAQGSYAGKSKLATFGGDHPEDLLPEPTAEFVGHLYGEQLSP